MERSFFKQVKDGFAANPEQTLRNLGVDVKKGGQGDWRQVACPLCTDESGSASISKKTGFLRCHQCDRKQDLFEWYAELKGCSTWEACQDLAKHVGVQLEAPKKRRGRAPREMTQELLELSIHNLWEEKWAEPLRKFLEQRKIAEPRILSHFGVGALNNSLTFAQWWPSGSIKGRYRRYHPHGGARKWTWSAGSGEALGIWPHFELREGDKIALFEGEHDCLAAWVRLRLYKQGWVPFTATGGASNPLLSASIPEDWREREIHIFFDNDVFQGPDLDKHLAPDERKRLELTRRRENLIYRVARVLEVHQCDVHLRAIPINAHDNWGGDFRDWLDAGGADLAEIPSYSLQQVLETKPEVEEAAFADVFTKAGKEVSSTSQVKSLEEETIVVPITSEIVCPMNSFRFCADCQAPVLFPDKLIYWNDRRQDLVEGLCESNFEDYVIRQVLAKPRACNQCRIRHLDYKSGVRWVAAQPDEEIEG